MQSVHQAKDGRELYFLDEDKSDACVLAKAEIIALFDDTDLFKLVSPLTIKFCWHGEKSLYVNPAYENTIFVSLEFISVSYKKYGADKTQMLLRDGLTHECAHLLHEYVSGILTKNVKRGERLSRSLTDMSFFKEPLLAERLSIEVLKSKIVTEGVAKYVQCVILPFVRSPTGETLSSLHAIYDKEGRSAAKQLVNSWKWTLAAKKYDSYLAALRYRFMNQNFNQLVRSRQPYAIGCHMVCAIMEARPALQVANVMQLEPAQFIHLYEDCMRDLGREPLISNTSGHGAFDFARAQRELLQQYQELKEKMAA